MNIRYSDIEEPLAKIVILMQGEYLISNRSIALLLLQGDHEIEELVRQREGSTYSSIEQVITQTRSKFSQPLRQVIALDRQHQASEIVAAATAGVVRPRKGIAETISRAMMNPFTGILIMLLVLYIGLYQFVGVFGAGIGVGFFEETIFGEWINPWFDEQAERFIPWQVLQDLFVGDYGLITLGITYAVAIILPIVGTFFIVFSVIEDSGYLPRLSMLIDRVFKRIGLSGRAVIPMVLGLGCDTMATVVTRTQETQRERILTTLLLALAIPCSAQLGVVLAILSTSPMALVIWVVVLTLVLLLVGFIAARLLPGRRSSFYMEIPPLRLPKLSNVMTKTVSRMQWYFAEVMPVFILASFILWLGDLAGVFDYVLRAIEPLVRSIGLPDESAVAFLYGFFRRDFGAAGLYDLHAEGILIGVPLVVAAVTLTLFVPCVAQFIVMLRERGVAVAFATAAFIFPFAFLVGFVLNRVLNTLGVTL